MLHIEGLKLTIRADRIHLECDARFVSDGQLHLIHTIKNSHSWRRVIIEVLEQLGEPNARVGLAAKAWELSQSMVRPKSILSKYLPVPVARRLLPSFYDVPEDQVHVEAGAPPPKLTAHEDIFYTVRGAYLLDEIRRFITQKYSNESIR